MKEIRALLRHALGTDRPSRFVSLVVFGNVTRKSTVAFYRARAAEVNLTWKDIKDKPTAELRRLFLRQNYRGRPEAHPDFEEITRELAHPGMRFQTWWKEWRAANPENSLSYSHAAALYQRYIKQSERTMRQRHQPGEKVFVDYMGDLPWYFDERGEKVEVQMFVSAMGRSGKVFAWCSATQTIPDWIEAHVRMFEFYGGAPQIAVCDNLKSGVTKPGTDPTIQRTYLELGDHYRVAIIPAGISRPKHKSKAEGGVWLMEGEFLPMLRHHRCGSIDELNTLLAQCVSEVNAKGFTKKADSREIVFQREDAPALQPLPAQRFEYTEWTTPRIVPKDYHVQVERHWYSVPESWVGHQVEAYVKNGEAVIHREDHEPVRHPHSTEVDGQTTNPEHMTAAHRAQSLRTREQLTAWAEAVGPNVREFVRLQFERKVPMQGYRKAEQARFLADKYGEALVEEICGEALAMRVATPSGLRQLLSMAVKQQATPSSAPATGTGPSWGALPVQPSMPTHRERKARRSATAPPAAPAAHALPVQPVMPVLRRSKRGEA